MTDTQFDALAQLLRMLPGPAKDAARLHFVSGLSVPDAARAVGIDYQLALKAVYRVQKGFKLAASALDVP